MKEKLRKMFLRFLDIFLTALISALLAVMTEWLKNKTGTSGVDISPTETGLVGGLLATAKNIKNIKIFG